MSNEKLLQCSIAKLENKFSKAITYTTVKNVISDIQSEANLQKAKYKRTSVFWNEQVKLGRRESNITNYDSGFLFMDFDQEYLDGQSPDELKKDLITLPYCLFTCLSSSKTGLHAVFLVTGKTTKQDSRDTYRQISVFIYKKFGIKSCKGSNKTVQLQHLPADKDILINYDAVAYVYKHNEETEQEYYKDFGKTKDHDLVKHSEEEIFSLTYNKELCTHYTNLFAFSLE